jgi:hypothetical protein
MICSDAADKAAHAADMVWRPLINAPDFLLGLGLSLALAQRCTVSEL